MTAPTIYAAMNNVMAEVQAIGKDQKVTEGPARFNFRGVDAVVNAVGPVLRKHGVIVVPHDVAHVEHERYLTGNNKPMHGVTVTIRWRFYGPAGDFIEAATAGQAADSGDKAVSKAHSVGYRTVLLQALCIPTDEPDPDTEVHERMPPPALASDETVNEIGIAIDALDDEHKQQLREVWAQNGLPKPASLTVPQSETARDLIRQVTAGDYDPKPETP